MAQTDLHYTFEPACNASENPRQHVKLDVVEFKLSEALSECYRLEVELLSSDSAIDFGLLLDQGATFTIWQAGKAVRQIHGLISDLSQGDSGHRRTRYRAIVEPQLARTRLVSDWRIFQQKTVPQILADIFKANHIAAYTIDTPNQQHNHLQREYCVQADTTDYDFIARLAAEEAFIYRFSHSPNGHRLLLTDAIQSYGALPPETPTPETPTPETPATNASQPGGQQQQTTATILYQPNPGGDRPQPALRTFTYREQVATARQTQRDYTFKNPPYAQQHSRYGQNLDHQAQHYERYDYPGRYKQDAAGSPFTQTRIQSLRRETKLAIAQGDDARLEPGLAFELTGHTREDMNTLWRPIRIEHSGKQHTAGEEEAAEAQIGTSYTQTAWLVPATADWKPHIPPKPQLAGPQIAHVVGPQGEEIYTDEWGRIKIQFPWDRTGQNNQHSSCWIRVAQGWGIGGGDGQQSIPRIGQEVIVHFLDGDPDQPIVSGRTNDALNPPPYELPKHKTRSTWKSHTHKGQGYNEIRFEDEREQEEIYIHAQKDQNIEILHNETTWIGNDRSEHVEANESIFIGHNRQEQVINDEAVEIGHDRKHHIINDAYLNIDNNHNIEIGNNRVEYIRNHRKDDITANHWEKVGGHKEIKVEGHHQIEAGEEIIRKTQTYDLKVQDKIVYESAGGKITIDNTGITLEGTINIKGTMTYAGTGGGDGISINGNPASRPFCITCWLKAIAERKALMLIE